MMTVSGTELVMAVSSLPAAGYAGLYLLFRFSGKLRVNAGGWHAGAVRVGGRVVASATWLLRAFQPLMALEARAAARFWRHEDDEEVSEVVVEVVSMV